MSEKNEIAWQVTIAAAVNLIILILIIAMSKTEAYAMGLGSGGERVSAVQRALKNKGYYSGEISGLYDFATRRGIRKFQAENGIEPSGNADYKTVDALGLNSENKIFSFETEILARYAQFVCGGRGYPEKLELCEKIIEKKASGQTVGSLLITENPDFYRKITEIEPSPDAVRAAYRALKNRR